jgi:hypothetical protein
MLLVYENAPEMLERIHHRWLHQEGQRLGLKSNIKDQDKQWQDRQELAELDIA